uniref:Uncharacterized protein n=1 Tax=Plectus sambesii TaxID=2011161 RepID=A0A914XM57_9BILA
MQRGGCKRRSVPGATTKNSAAEKTRANQPNFVGVVVSGYGVTARRSRVPPTVLFRSRCPTSRQTRVAIPPKTTIDWSLDWATPPITAATTEEGTDDAQRAPLHLRVQRPPRLARALLQPPQSPIRTLIAADNDSSAAARRDRRALVQWSLATTSAAPHADSGRGKGMRRVHARASTFSLSLSLSSTLVFWLRSPARPETPGSRRRLLL